MSVLMRTDDHNALKGLYNQYGLEDFLSFVIHRVKDSEIEARLDGRLAEEKHWKQVNSILDESFFKIKDTIGFEPKWETNDD